jgi:hypothetical protein
MVLTAAALLESSEPALLETAASQLRLIVLGARHWLDGVPG